MLFKRFRKGLTGFMLFTMMGSMVCASETVDGPTEIITTTSEVYESVEDYKLQETKLVEKILEKGVLLNQSVTKENIIFTLVGMYSDDYTYRLVCSLETADKSDLSDEESMHIERLVLDTKEDIEQMLSQEANEEVEVALSYEEVIKQEAEKDENLKQFIREDGTVDIEGVDAYYEALYASQEEEAFIGGTSSYGSSWGSCKLADSSSKKIYFLLEGSYNEPLPETMQLLGEQLVKEMNKTEEVELDLTAYLKEKKDVTPKTKHNERLDQELQWLEEMDQDDEEYEYWKEEVKNIPEQVLEPSALGLKLCDNPLVPMIDNIGFVDNQLHILLTREVEEDALHNHHDLILQQGENCLMSVWQVSSSHSEGNKRMEENYYVFDIADAEALSDCNFSIQSYETESIAKGPWMLEVKMQPTKDKVTKELSQEITIGKTHQAMLTKCELTPSSLTLHLEIKDKGFDEQDLGEILLNKKDGTSLSIEYSNARGGEKNQLTEVYVLPELLESTEEVVSIIIDGQKIEL